MDFDRVFSTFRISASGLAAERLRMKVIANNIANANDSAKPGQTPFQKDELVFRAVLDDAIDDAGLGGVEVVQKVKSDAEFRKAFLPGHPHAIKEGPLKGYVRFSNVNPVLEMVDMVAASRAYEANLAVLTTFKEMMHQTLRLGR
jgi:flagellar basal-body rod protein FlgC